MNKTLIIGPVFCDLLLEGYKRIPGEGEELFLDNINFSIGGAAITATALAKLGVETRIVSVIGADVLGQYLKDELSSKGIDIASLYTAEELSTGLTLIFPYEKDRGFITRPVNDKVFISSILSGLEMLDINNYSNIQLTFSLLREEGIFSFIEKAGAAGVSVSLDIGYGEAATWSKDDFRLIDGIDYFTPNDKEAGMITGSADIEEALRILRRHVKHPIITLGEDGAAFLDETEQFRILPAPQKNAVNTTGAGDSFTAGLMYGLSKNFSLTEAVGRGLLTGSLTAASIDSVSPEISEDMIESLAEKGV